LLFGSEQYGFVDDDLKEYFCVLQGLDVNRSDLRTKAIPKTHAMQAYNSRYTTQSTRNLTYIMSVIMS